MADVIIRVFKHGESQPEKTITIPGSVLNVASKLIPKRAVTALQEEGIDLDELIRLSKNPDIQGTLVEIKERKKNEKIIISLEQGKLATAGRVQYSISQFAPVMVIILESKS